MSDLYPASLLDATDKVLGTFESALGTLRTPSDAEVFAAVQRVVLDLNAINDQHDGAGYETGEREELCQYIDQAFTDRGIAVPTLTTRHGLGRHEITDKWRDW